MNLVIDDAVEVKQPTKHDPKPANPRVERGKQVLQSTYDELTVV